MRKIAWNRKNVSIGLAAIIIPVSLVVVLALNSPREVENITVDAVSWSMNRPSNHTIIDESMNNSYNEAGVSVTLEIHVNRYMENDLYLSDHIWFRLNVTADVTEGFISSVLVRYQLVANSDIGVDPNWFALRNLKMEKIEGFEQWFVAVGVNQPQNCSLRHTTCWELGYDNNVEQVLEATAEILCFNGTAYQKIHVPIDLFVHAVQTS